MPSSVTVLHIALIAGLAALAAGPQAQARDQAPAQPPLRDRADLLQTRACLAARQQFEALLAAGGPRDRLQAVRRQTALDCFGQEPASPPDPRTTRPPVTVPWEPIRLRSDPALAQVPPPRPAAAPPQLALSPPTPRINHCDVAGCWDDQGQHYDRQGPLLLGPGGPCHQADGLLNCP